MLEVFVNNTITNNSSMVVRPLYNEWQLFKAHFWNAVFGEHLDVCSQKTSSVWSEWWYFVRQDL